MQSGAGLILAMSDFADLLLTHMERAAEHAQWRRAFSQALLDPSTTKPGHVGVSKEARGGPSSGVLPQQQPHIIFERLYQGGLIGERTWDRLLQVYPQLQVCLLHYVCCVRLYAGHATHYA